MSSARGISKSERDELRRIIRQRFKVLRADVQVRKNELLAQMDRQIADKYAAADQAWDGMQVLVDEAVREANRRVNDLYREHFGAEVWGLRHDRTIVNADRVAKPTVERSRDRREGMRAIEGRVSEALLELERREVDLLEELATVALESAAAKEFVARVPTVGELVPAYRVPAIET